jgi:hypothetical protein
LALVALLLLLQLALAGFAMCQGALKGLGPSAQFLSRSGARLGIVDHIEQNFPLEPAGETSYGCHDFTFTRLGSTRPFASADVIEVQLSGETRVWREDRWEVAGLPSFAIVGWSP